MALREERTPGELIYVDVKKVTMIPNGDGRATGDGSIVGTRASAADSEERVTCEKLFTSVRGHLRRQDSKCLALFGVFGVIVVGIMTESDSLIRSPSFSDLLSARRVKHTHTRFRGFRKNSKAKKTSQRLAASDSTLAPGRASEPGPGS